MFLTKITAAISSSVALLGVTILPADKTLLEDHFAKGLSPEWSVIRPDPAGRRFGPAGMELRVAPGNMWGPANDARNVLVHAIPKRAGPNPSIELSMSIEHHPTEQYEQVDLVWFCDESNMVKIGEELVDGRLSIVMGREQADRTRTIAIIPLDSAAVELRLRSRQGKLEGAYHLPGDARWRVVGTCEPPPGAIPKASIQTYQGPVAAEHWAKIHSFRIRALDEKSP